MSNQKLTYELIIKQKLNVYEVLDINELASDNLIRKAYRRQALKYHPDKNPSPEAREKFELINQVYEFLIQNKAEKAKYDEYLKRLQEQEANKQLLQQSIREKREKLEKLEKAFAENERQERDRKQLIGRLREQGMQKRLEAEARLFENSLPREAAGRAIASDNAWYYADPIINDKYKTVNVRWKYSEKTKDDFDEVLLTKLMSVFGKVKSANASGPSDKKYSRGTVVFESMLAIEQIIRFDIDKSWRIWEKTGYKYLSKQIRSIKWSEQRLLDKQPPSATLYQVMADILGFDKSDPRSTSGDMPLSDYTEVTLLRWEEIVGKQNIAAKWAELVYKWE